MAVSFEFDFQRTSAAITYLASRNLPELTKYKICKLLFLADKFHLVQYGRVITGDKYCALPKGPIPSRTLNLLNAVLAESIRDQQAEALKQILTIDHNYLYPRFRADIVVDPDQLSASDYTALDKVISEYGQMGFEALRLITHETFAYRKAWSERPEGSNGADMYFEEFFEDDPDAIVGARETMLEDDSMRKIFPAYH